MNQRANNAQAAHEWALKRRVALEKAESIKAERRRGVVDKSTHTFKPRLEQLLKI